VRSNYKVADGPHRLPDERSLRTRHDAGQLAGPDVDLNAAVTAVGNVAIDGVAADEVASALAVGLLR
jgi:hypothetical protein